MNELIEAFDEYFELVSADTPELKAKSFRLRYDVICEEMEMPEYEQWKYPDQQETDDDDDRSTHCLLRHRPTGTIAGSVRLVLYDPKDQNRPFPIEKHAGHVFDPQKVNVSRLPRRHTAEMSRFVLSKRFRSRKGEDQYEFGSADIDTDRRRTVRANSRDRRHFPHPVLGLVVGAMYMAANRQVSHWYAIMEPILNRLLRRFALDLTPIGPTIEFHGRRQPHLDAIKELLDRTYMRRPDVWKLVTNNGKLWANP